MTRVTSGKSRVRVQIPRDCGQQFQSKVAGDSDARRPPIPIDPGHPDGVTVQSAI